MAQKGYLEELVVKDRSTRVVLTLLSLSYHYCWWFDLVVTRWP